jgi:hypothetical protein
MFRSLRFLKAPLPPECLDSFGASEPEELGCLGGDGHKLLSSPSCSFDFVGLKIDLSGFGIHRITPLRKTEFVRRCTQRNALMVSCISLQNCVS